MRTACRNCQKRKGIERLKGFCPVCSHQLSNASSNGRGGSAADTEDQHETLILDTGRDTSASGTALVRTQRAPRLRVHNQISNRRGDRSQLLADFLSTYYPAASSRHQGASWLSALPWLDTSSPLLGNSVDTVTLAHLALSKQDQNLLRHARETYSWALNMIIGRIARPNRKLPPEAHRDLVVSALLIGLCEDFILGKPKDPYECSYGKHILGVQHYLSANGSSTLDLDKEIEHKLYQNMRMNCLFLSLSQRKALKLIWVRSDWQPPAGNKSIGNGLTTCYPLIVPLPKLLEEVDEQLASGQPDLTHLASTYNELEDVKKNVLHWLKNEAPLCERPLGTVRITDHEAFDMEIEEHCFITTFTNPPILSFHEFADAQHGLRHTTSWLVALLVDCTLLRILHSVSAAAAAAPPSPLETDNININKSPFSPQQTPQLIRDLERDAFILATNICASVHFYGTVKSIGYGTFQIVLLRVAKAFFEEIGSFSRVSWCQCCIIATELRMQRLAMEGYPSLCKVASLGMIARGVRFKRGVPLAAGLAVRGSSVGSGGGFAGTAAGTAAIGGGGGAAPAMQGACPYAYATMASQRRDGGARVGLG